MYFTPSPRERGVDDLLADLQVAVDVEVEQHEPPLRIVGVTDDPVRDDVVPQFRVAVRWSARPHVLDRVRIAPVVLVLRVLVGVLAVGIEHDLTDGQRLIGPAEPRTLT